MLILYEDRVVVTRSHLRLTSTRGPICIVEFDDYARFAELWRHIGTGLAADLDGSGEVDFADLGEFADLWLRCCPAGWPLK